ncbi:nitrate reductase [Acuticoccus kandeliae]|uniref:nitrate reductase n=1 Tax=Acuticoccus kandeliae TaxID=2073160 RepID=UPI000D3EA4F1|nr:nitrate reductase [Acuticoccus kandeliae]
MDAERFPPVATTCPYCGVGCGVIARPEADGAVAISGDANHPANFGRLCSKGSALGETIGLEDRLLTPIVDGARASWDAALDRVAATFARTIAEHGPDSVALYVSGQLLTEDYYVANKWMKGFVGSANIDTNSRLCMASSVAGHRRAFGADTVPGTYTDIECADLVVLVGSNLAWCHPVLFQRLLAAKAERPAMRIVVIDPRQTATTAAADLHLAIRAETDVTLFAGLLGALAEAGAADAQYVSRHTRGLDDALAAVAGLSVATIAARCGLAEADVRTFYEWVRATERTVTIYSQGVNQSARGTDKVNAIINTHLLTGRIGKEGAGPFSVTGQPNAMGGREVGGLANMLACHMDLENAGHRDIVRAHWQAPRMAEKPGLKAVDLFEAVHDGRVKALWVMATNPAASMPEAARIDEALARIPFLVVSDVVASTDTLRHAHVKLPAAAWGEKDGTVTNSERRISRQRPFLPMPGEARADWAIISEVATRMGFAGFDYASPAEIFDEYARLSAAENNGTRDFDIGGLAGLGADGYDRLAPLQWPKPAGGEGRPRFFANGRFYTPDQRARFVATPSTDPERRAPRHPFTLNTGRVRDHWHTMTRTGRSARLSSHLAEPFAEIHPDDAARLGIAPATIVALANPHGRALVRALITDRQQTGSVFVPMHWNDETSASGRVDRLVTARTDAVSGQPALKSARVSLAPFAAGLYGFAVSREAIAADGLAYWAKATIKSGLAFEIADAAFPDDPALFAERLLGHRDLVGVVDAAAGSARFAAFDGERLLGAIFLAREPVPVSRTWANGLLAAPAARRIDILAGRPGADRPDPGPIICACFQVGANDIIAAAKDGAATVEAIGARLHAGTNCGSCRSEIARLLAPPPCKGTDHDHDERAHSL